MVVSKAVPIITWQRPADISFGTRLSEAQLNATANIPGTFNYAPPAGSILPAGVDRLLSVRFTPTDTSNYTEVDATVFITINPPTILLFTEANSEKAIAFEAMMWFRGPFSVTTNLYGHAVPTRIMIFAKGLDFDTGEGFSALTLEANDSQGVTRRLDVEFVGRVPGYYWLTQINFILPHDLPAGEVWLQLKNQDVVSNRALIYIKP